MSSVTLNVQLTKALKNNATKRVQTEKSFFERLLNKEEQIAVVGLGYVGLPLALHMAERFSVLGFDVNQSKIEALNTGYDPCEEVLPSDFLNKDIQFYGTGAVLEDAKMFIVAVPTPVDEKSAPDLRALKAATKTVAAHLSIGSIVVFESTVYPGCTEEVCVPILEEYSCLKYNEDFFVGYSPERINPGDEKNTFATIKKIVSASTPEALEEVANIYGSVVTAGIHKAPTMKVAEAAKVVENTQRDVNIALMNELSYIFDKIDVNIHEVLEAAGTKWNFLNFFPGLVGGHCIGIDPYYMMHKALEVGIQPRLIENSRKVNENMSFFLASKMMRAFAQFNKFNKDINILIKGITFKENVKDVRNSKVVDLIKKLQFLGYNVTIEDPYAEAHDVMEEYMLHLTDEREIKNERFDAVVFAVNHKDYHEMKAETLENLLTQDGFVLDIRGTFEHLVKNHQYITI
jgi:UDP-N-acetyl-D-galactosamine dehydrogenase